MVDDWGQSAPGMTAAPPTLSWESGGQKCGDLSRTYGILMKCISTLRHVPLKQLVDTGVDKN